jgi:ribonuclease P protein component
VLKKANRIVSAGDFRTAIRRGRRISTPNAQLYVMKHVDGGPSRVGLVVSKQVGNSVKRNRVSRRLRAIGLDFVRSQPTGTDLIIRALPGSRLVSWATLQSEILTGLERS